MNSKKVSPNHLSYLKLIEDGYYAEKTEYHTRGRTHDLFGFGDLIGLRKSEILLVQATSASNVSARIKKITEHPNVGVVRDAGIRILVWGWRMRDGQWICREIDLS